MTTIHDTIKALLERRIACVDEVTAIDQELRSVRTTVTDAIAQLTPLPAPATASAPAPEAASTRVRRPAASTPAAVGPGLIPLEREIKTLLVKGPLGSRQMARALNKPFERVQASLKALANVGRVVKNGNRGPSCTWSLAGARAVSIAAGIRVTAPVAGEQFETVFPKPGNPKASPREAIEGART